MKNEWAALVEESRQAPFLEAQLASRTVDVNVEFVNELQHPKVGKITGEFISEKLSKFTFGNIMVREMDDLIRIQDRPLPGTDESHTGGMNMTDSIRRVFMITELYYGTIKMVVEKQFSAELDAQLTNLATGSTYRNEGSHAVEYEFSHDNVPFAMRIERIRTFNG